MLSFWEAQERELYVRTTGTQSVEKAITSGSTVYGTTTSTVAAMEAATTLADSLLEDLDDLSDVENDQQEEDEYSDDRGDHDGGATVTASPTNASVMEIDRDQDDHKLPAAHRDSLTKPSRRLLEDDKLKEHLELVRSLQQSNPHEDTKLSSMTTDEMAKNYQLIVTSNKFLTQLTNEYQKAYSTLCEAYHAKFPELEELIVDPKQYRQTVALIGNQEMDMTKIINDELNNILSSNQIITISVAGSTSSGRTLSQQEWEHVEQSCQYMDQVESAMKDVSSFVESRMESLAPNVCAIVGSAIAARLLGLAGGISELSTIPACNLQVLGQVKQSTSSRAGMSAFHTKPHMGIIAESDVIQRCPKHMHRKVLKLVASKVALAARCDYVNAEKGKTPNADAGRQFLEEISAKLAKWDEPDKAPVVKALPKPDLATKKRRGGKRIRKLKERFEETEMMKQANKRAFSKEVGEYGDDAMGLTLGMLDMKEGHGNLLQPVEKRKMRQANTKASRKRAAQLKASSGVATSGLASSMVFTPVQGLELVNPNANRDRVREANLKWFSENSGFQSALPKDK